MAFLNKSCWTLLTSCLVLLSQLHDCRGQVQLSLREREGNQIELTCSATSTVLQEEWKFWIGEPDNILSYSVIERDISSIKIAVDLSVANEGLYYCGYRGEISNSEGEFTSKAEIFSWYTILKM